MAYRRVACFPHYPVATRYGGKEFVHRDIPARAGRGEGWHVCRPAWLPRPCTPRFFQGMWRGRWSLLSVRWKGLSFRRGMQEVALLMPFCCVPRGRCGPSVAWLMSAAGSSIPALLISLTDTRAWVSSGFRASLAPVQGRRVPTGDYSDVSSSGGSRAIPL